MVRPGGYCGFGQGQAPAPRTMDDDRPMLDASCRDVAAQKDERPKASTRWDMNPASGKIPTCLIRQVPQASLPGREQDRFGHDISRYLPRHTNLPASATTKQHPFMDADAASAAPLQYVQQQRFQGEHSSKKHVAASSAPKSSQAAAVISGCVCIAAHMGEFAVLLDEGFFARAWSVLRRLLLIHQERSNATFRIRLKESWNPGPADLLPLAKLCRPWQAVR
ncbi:hypothetical protein FDECE_17338 [Fusarium decemcellulare]|nr:hypothetical protein FDECE_17338 [Fusarium decemcellulare]